MNLESIHEIDMFRDGKVKRFYLTKCNALFTVGGGVRVWSKESGLGPDAAGLRGFKPHPPHHYVEI